MMHRSGRTFMAGAAATLLACAAPVRKDTPAPPATLYVLPRASEPAPAGSSAAPVLATEPVWLLVQDAQGREWSRCIPNSAEPYASCSPIAELRGARLQQNDRNEYLVRDAGGTWLWNAATGQRLALAAPAGEIECRLRDGTLVSFDFRPNYTRVSTSRGGPWTPVASQERLRANAARTLPDGMVLFKSAPSMGGPESPYFVDLLIGKPTYLYVSASLGGSPRRLATGPQFMDADLVDGGRYAVYFSPGEVDQAANTRSFSVEAIETATSKVTQLGVVKMPARVQRGGGAVYLRTAPDAIAFPNGPWFLYASDHDWSAHPVTHRLYNVQSGAAEGFDDARVGSPVPPVQFGTLPIGAGRRWTAHIVVRDSVELRVLALPSLQTVLRVRGAEVSAADVIAP